MINVIAIIIAALVYFGVHFSWYFPFIFGNKWLKLVGKESEPKSKILRDTYIMIPTSFITVLILAILIDMLAISDIIGLLIVSLLVWIGLVATIGINQSNFNDRTSVLLFLIEYGFYLIGFIIAGLILIIWP